MDINNIRSWQTIESLGGSGSRISAMPIKPNKPTIAERIDSLPAPAKVALGIFTAPLWLLTGCQAESVKPQTQARLSENDRQLYDEYKNTPPSVKKLELLSRIQIMRNDYKYNSVHSLDEVVVFSKTPNKYKQIILQQTIFDPIENYESIDNVFMVKPENIGGESCIYLTALAPNDSTESYYDYVLKNIDVIIFSNFITNKEINPHSSEDSIISSTQPTGGFLHRRLSRKFFNYDNVILIKVPGETISLYSAIIHETAHSELKKLTNSNQNGQPISTIYCEYAWLNERYAYMKQLEFLNKAIDFTKEYQDPNIDLTSYYDNLARYVSSVESAITQCNYMLGIEDKENLFPFGKNFDNELATQLVKKLTKEGIFDN